MADGTMIGPQQYVVMRTCASRSVALMLLLWSLRLVMVHVVPSATNERPFLF